MVLTRERWLEVLATCGVRAMTALKWCPHFAKHVQPARFNLGLQEMDDFLAQILHESGNLEHLVENLNYRPETLMRVWPTRFPGMAKAMQYAYDDEKLATEVYGGRLGNNWEGDGFKYRGRGLIQVTGKANYALLESLTKQPLVDFPVMLEDPETALECSLLWWENKVPDSAIDTIERSTRVVNGGLNGLEDRRKKYAKTQAALNP